jgi:CobQ-like glutamine amidotransferase family enzyme
MQRDGAMAGNLWATYIHTHFLNMPQMASRFVSACAEMKIRLANETMKAGSSRKLQKKENV